MPASGTKKGGAKSASAKLKPSRARKPSAGKVSGAQGSLPDGPAMNALELLEADHRTVEELFSQFEDETSDAAKRDIAGAICVALKIHARLEEELFYPAIAKVLEDTSLVDEALVEHASAKDLIAQIEAGTPGEALFDARVKVLGEYVDHHVTEEEDEIFPQCRSANLDLDALGAAMASRRQELSLGFVVSNPVIGLANTRGDANA